MSKIQALPIQKRRLSHLCVRLIAACSLASSAASAQPGQAAENTGAPAAQKTAAATPAGPTDRYKVIYASHLFGYYRVPEVQTVAAQRCDAKYISPTGTPEADLFRKFLNQAESNPDKYEPTTLRLATGDNFAPFLLSRQMWVGNPTDPDPNGVLAPKEKFTADSSGVWVPNSAMSITDHASYVAMQLGDSPVAFDNVGCFLRLMQFDAVVPGEEDFYFGPSRLQFLAKYLAKEIGNLYPTRMLGVNLYMATNELTSATSESAAGDPHQPATPHGGDELPIKITPPKTVLPWMRSIKMRGWMPGSQAQVCLVDIAQLLAGFTATSGHRHKTVADITSAEEATICVNPALGLSVPEAHNPADPADFTTEITGDSVLNWDTDYAVAVLSAPPAPGGPARHLLGWKQFTVVPPFFGYDRMRRAPDVSVRQVSGRDVSERPWVIGNDHAERVAVFGVVDPNLAQFVGRYNAAWLERQDTAGTPIDDHYETDLKISDPAEALGQAIEYCVRVGDCTDGTRIVLLAQMAEETATDMVRSFRSYDLLGRHIDLIITESDPDRGTGFRKTERTNGGSPLEFNDPVIVVPSPGESTPDPEARQETFVGLQRALVTPGDFTTSGAPRVVQNETIQAPSNVPPAITDWFVGPAANLLSPTGMTLLQHLQAQTWGGRHATDGTKLAVAGPSGDDDWRQGLREVALKRMELYCKSDAAMVQLRDIFFIEPVFTKWRLTANGYKALMDAIFWKGDYIQCLNVNGGTITSVLQRSQDLQQRQYYGLLSDLSLSLDWSLDALGVNADQKNATHRLVADKLIDPKKLYSVAVTDFLGNGDTGYPAFQGAEPPPDRAWSKTTLMSLSKAITTDRAGPERAEDELDSLSRVAGLPPSEQHQRDTVTSDWGRSFEDSLLNRKDDFTLGTRALETTFQRRPIWSIELYKMDLSYSVAAHSGLERAVPEIFPGVSAVDLTAQDSSSFTMDYLARVQHDWVGFSEFYVQSELNYGYKKTRQAAKLPTGTTCYPTLPVPAPAQPTACNYGDPYSRNQTADFFYTEVGYAIRLGSRKNPYGWKIQLPAAVQTALEPSLALPEGLTGATTVTTIPSPRSYFVEGRPGIRLDFSFPKPANWTIGQAGGAGSQAGGSQQSAGGGKGGKGGGASSSSASSSSGQPGSAGQSSSSGGGGGGGGNQTQTFDSFLEAGIEYGESMFGPKAFVFNDPSMWLTNSLNYFNTFPQTTCNAATGGGKTTVPLASIVNCFLTDSYPVPGAPPGLTSPFTQPTFSSIESGRFHLQRGFYTNYHLDIPVAIPENRYTVFSNMEFVLDLRSDFFFGGSNDTPLDTHFLVDAKQALNIPIFALFSGKVSLAPTVEMIFYTNKITNNLYRSYSGSVALSYTFEWRNGLKWSKIAGYSNPIPTLPTLPSR
jgi:hypothetical protein